MPFDSNLAAVISNQFRSAVTTRLSDLQRLNFEDLLRILLGVKDLRNVQLWTRFGRQTRNIINRSLGEFELDLRTFLASKFINLGTPSFPVKQKPFLLPISLSNAQKFLQYITDNFIREYCTRIYIEGSFIIIEYAADSDTPTETPDLDSPEFEDILE